MTSQLDCSFSTPAITSTIHIAQGILQKREFLTSIFKVHEKIGLITHQSLKQSLAEPLAHLLAQLGYKVHILSFPEGEHYKTRHTKQLLEDELLENAFGRDCCLIALGGGVVSDLVGYVAGTYCRGVSLVVIPTTLMGMVDAAIGGKNGINVEQGKNLIGTIHQPKAVIIDPDVLKNLPLSQLRNGTAEMIKHGIIADRSYFDYLENHAADLFSLDKEIVGKTILRSCQIKKEIVLQDERELGLRGLLNFGHTVGHALEKLSNYQIAHGEAVALGMLVESRLSVELNILSESDYQTIHACLLKFGFSLKFTTQTTVDKFFNAMQSDKKSIAGRPRFVLLKKIGKPAGPICEFVEEKVLKKVLEDVLNLNLDGV